MNILFFDYGLVSNQVFQKLALVVEGGGGGGGRVVGVTVMVALFLPVVLLLASKHSR